MHVDNEGSPISTPPAAGHLMRFDNWEDAQAAIQFWMDQGYDFSDHAGCAQSLREHAKLQEEVEDLKKKLGDMTHARDQWRTLALDRGSSEDLKEQVEDLKRKLEASRFVADNRLKTMQACQKKIAELSDQRRQAEKEIEELRASLHRRDKEITAFQIRLSRICNVVNEGQ